MYIEIILSFYRSIETFRYYQSKCIEGRQTKKKKTVIFLYAFKFKPLFYGKNNLSTKNLFTFIINKLVHI